MSRNRPLVRVPWGHQSRKCCYCGKVGPRTIVAGGWAHKRCIPKEAPSPLHVQIEKKIAEIEADPRFKAAPAAVQINAPLALIQTSLSAEHDTLRWVLKQLKEQDHA
jgi:hypothetical protein